MQTVKYLVPIKWHITIFPSPLLQVRGLETVVCSHMEGSVDDGTVAIVGAVQEEECHQDEDGQEDHHPVALWSLQCKQRWSNVTKYIYLNTNLRYL